MASVKVEAGETELGYPYFVMEYVPGIPITRYCDRNRLDIRSRLRLFIAVCEGIQHAHRKGIVHRDIKPSNILVTEELDQPIPKIIDFGLAKAAVQPLTQENPFTGSMVIGTPAYSSPEMLRSSDWGVDLDNRSDVYSLGVLLYELLVGVLPFGSGDDGKLVPLILRITEQDAPIPSIQLKALEHNLSAAIAEKRDTKLLTLARLVRGDLDAITMKAIARARSRRYLSAAELAADVKRYLANEPVLARDTTAINRFAQFIFRQMPELAAALLVFLASIASAAGLAHGAQETGREANGARQITAIAQAMEARAGGQ